MAANNLATGQIRLPVGWEECTDRTGEAFYRETASGYSTYMHPNDVKYHDMLLEIRSQLEPTDGGSHLRSGDREEARLLEMALLATRGNGDSSEDASHDSHAAAAGGGSGSNLRHPRADDEEDLQLQVALLATSGENGRTPAQRIIKEETVSSVAMNVGKGRGVQSKPGHDGVRLPLAALSPSNLNTGRRHAFVAPGGGFDVNSVYSSDELAGRGASASGAPAPGEFEPATPAPGAPAPAPAPGTVVVRPGVSTHSSKEIEQQDAEWKKLISALKEVPKEDRNNKKLVVTLLGMISLARLHRGSCV